MNIWLATVGEPLPIDPNSPRLLRTGQLAAWLAAAGHQVTFWTNAFDHYRKCMRTEATHTYVVSDNYKIIALAGRAYRRNVSIARVLSHRDVARSFEAEVEQHAPPDVIISSYPIEELCRSLLDYAEPRRIPVIIDTRDFWPDIFAELLPGPMRPLGDLLLSPLNHRAQQTLARATGLSGMTESALDWGLRKAGRERRESDLWFPFSYAGSSGNPTETGASAVPGGIAEQFRSLAGTKVCFLGTLSTRSNLEVVVEAFRLLQQQNVPAQLAICGRGEAEADLRERAAGLDNVHFPGWLNEGELRAIMNASDYGLLPYDRSDFHMSLPNKFVEYLAGGLSVLSCTPGEVRRFLDEHGCGKWVPSNAGDMAAAIAGAVVTPQTVAAQKRRAREVFEQKFAQDKVFRQVLGHLVGLTARKTSTAR